jgi:tetratricopeptide (TPR) repeat protein
MSKLWREHFGEARRALAFDSLYRPQPAAFATSSNDAIYHRAAALMGASEPVTYLEFGVADGHSIRKIAREFLHPDCLFVGFDSFVGLPEDWMMHKRGAFSNRGQFPDLGDGRVRFVKGWFQNTFHESLSWLSPRLSGRVLVHYDADLYSSTMFLLTSLWPHCREYHFIMDDFMVDDIVALHDFSLSYPVRIEFLARRGDELPGTVLGKMTRMRFALAGEDVDEILAQADSLANSGQTEAALRLWQRLRLAHPRMTNAWLFPASHLRGQLRFAEAEALLSEARTCLPADPDLMIEWAFLAHHQRDWTAALRRWERVRDDFPGHESSHLFGGVALRELGRYDEADAWLTGAMHRFPTNAEAAVHHGWVANARRDWTEALRRWNDVRREFPNHAAPYFGSGVALRELGRLDEAEAILADGRLRFPADAGVALEYGWVAQMRGDWPEAARRWREARIVAPRHSGGYVWGAQALRALGRDVEAETLLREACAALPDQAEPTIELARFFEAKKNWTEAGKCWQDVTIRFPNSPEGPAGLAGCQNRSEPPQ